MEDDPIQPSLTKLLHEWLAENKIESHTGWSHRTHEVTAIRGFGWRIEICDNFKLLFFNRLANGSLELSAADPAAFEQLKSRILQIERDSISYMVEHIDDYEEPLERI